MKPIKKSFNITPDMAQRVDDFLQQNPGLSFTLIMNKALETWFENPTIKVNLRQHNDEDVDAFMRANSGLMDKLSR
ncbi:MAG: hypothetical protein EOP04_13885 [Proteobacteria bacterium]|nr:MAG: hypothetical protein EOP04_13885 [Pseudomonadota bacterium]